MDEKPLFSTRWYDIINDDDMLVVKQRELDAPEEAPAIDIEGNDIVSITYGVQYFTDIEELKEFENASHLHGLGLTMRHILPSFYIEIIHKTWLCFCSFEV